MFSDRLWTLKVVFAATALLLLCHHGERALSERFPSLELAAQAGPDLVGRQVILLAKHVASREDGAFTIESGIGPFRVTTPSPPPVGEYVTALATITGPRALHTESVQVNVGYVWKRTATYAMSVVTLLACLWVYGRGARLRARGGVFVARGGAPEGSRADG